jgi:hypothetical protein
MDNSSKNLLKYIQINLQRSKHSTAQLNEYILNNNIDIIFAHEPYTIAGKVRGESGFKVVGGFV